mgnify:FL=1
MLEKVVDIFIVEKYKDKKVMAIVFGVIFIILIGSIICITTLSIKVDNSEEIKEKLIGKTINLNGDNLEFTEENLLDVQVIYRKTERDVKDIVKVKMKVNRNESLENIESTVYLNYKNGEWNYDKIICGEVHGITENEELEKYLINYFKEKGIETTDDIRIFPSTIKKISNVNLSEQSIYSGKEFFIDVVLYNGLCSQSCKLRGIIYYDKEKLGVKNVAIDSKGNISKDKDVNLNFIEDIVKDEIDDNGIFKIKNLNRCKEIYLKLEEKSIESFEIKDYRVKDDYSIRVEINGEIYLKKYKESFVFDGIIFISRNLSEGHRKNAKDIIIYDVPLT